MSNFIQLLDGLSGRLHRFPLNLLSLFVSLFLAAALMWDPHAFASVIGGFNFIKALLLIWGTCTGFIHAVGFKPHFWLWQLVFFPAISWCVFLLILVLLMY